MSNQTQSDRMLAAWRDRIASELKGSAKVEDLGLMIEPDIHVPATHIQAPDDSGVHALPRTAMRYEPLVRSVAEWRTLRSLDPEIRGPALVHIHSENDGLDEGSDAVHSTEFNIHASPDAGIRILQRLVSGKYDADRITGAGLLVDPLAVALLSSDAGPAAGSAGGRDAAPSDAVNDGSIRKDLLERSSGRPVMGCVDACALDSVGAAGPTIVAWSLLSLSAWLDSLAAGDLEAGGRLERIRILAPVGNRPMVDSAILTAIRDLSAALIQLYAQANGGPDRPVSPVLHAISSRSAVVRSAAPADDAGNLVRMTLQAVAASSAGADIVSLLPYDAHRSPDADSIRLSTGIHRMLHHESGLHRTLQPFAGSYAFETIVRKVSDLAWSRFLTLARQGSPAHSVRSGLLDRWIQEDRDTAGHPVRVGLDRYVPDAAAQVS